VRYQSRVPINPIHATGSPQDVVRLTRPIKPDQTNSERPQFRPPLSAPSADGFSP
jgi:hypothetical protein